MTDEELDTMECMAKRNNVDDFVIEGRDILALIAEVRRLRTFREAVGEAMEYTTLAAHWEALYTAIRQCDRE